MRPIHRIILLVLLVVLILALAFIWLQRGSDDFEVVETTVEIIADSEFTETANPGSVVREESPISATEAAPEDTPTAIPTVTEQRINPTLTTSPTSTTAPTAAATKPPDPTATIELTAAVLVAVLPDGIDRTCPDPAPGKPDYNHYYLSGQPWPSPIEDPQGHLWLSKPLPGGGRLLYTDWLPYGYDAGGRYLLHNGVDVADPMGTPLLAASDGQVVVAGPDKNALYGWRCDWYGHLVVLELDQQWLGKPVYLLYGHVLNILVEAGQNVQRGEPLAEVGVGGAAGNPHLHFEVRVGTNEFKSTRNPFLWLRPPETRGVLVGRLVDPEGRPWQGVAVTAIGRSEDTENKTSWTYLGDRQQLIKPDEEYAENFVIPDLRPGSYDLYLELQGQSYTVPFHILSGELTAAEIITEPYRTPAPEISPSTTEPSTESTPED